MSKSIKNNRRPIYISTDNITNLKYILEYSPKGGMLSELYDRINNRSKELKKQHQDTIHGHGSHTMKLKKNKMKPRS